jgi:hypothetical protein
MDKAQAECRCLILVVPENACAALLCSALLASVCCFAATAKRFFCHRERAIQTRQPCSPCGRRNARQLPSPSYSRRLRLLVRSAGPGAFLLGAVLSWDHEECALTPSPELQQAPLMVHTPLPDLRNNCNSIIALHCVAVLGQASPRPPYQLGAAFSGSEGP